MFATGAHKYGLIYFNCNFFQRYKIIPTVLGDSLSSGGDINDLYER